MNHEAKIQAVKVPNDRYKAPWWNAKGEALMAIDDWPFAKTATVSVTGCRTRAAATGAVRSALRSILGTGIVALVLSGCVGLEGHASTPSGESCLDSCRRYDDQYLAYYALGMVFSGTTAAAGTGGVLTATLADEPNADIGLAATAAASGIGAVVFNWLAGESAERYTTCKQECLVQPMTGEP